MYMLLYIIQRNVFAHVHTLTRTLQHAEIHAQAHKDTGYNAFVRDGYAMGKKKKKLDRGVRLQAEKYVGCTTFTEV